MCSLDSCSVLNEFYTVGWDEKGLCELRAALVSLNLLMSIVQLHNPATCVCWAHRIYPWQLLLSQNRKLLHDVCAACLEMWPSPCCPRQAYPFPHWSWLPSMWRPTDYNRDVKSNRRIDLRTIYRRSRWRAIILAQSFHNFMSGSPPTLDELLHIMQEKEHSCDSMRMRRK